MNNLDKRTYYNILFSYYSNLFTEHQQNMFKSYYEYDYSLQEIADEENITRSAVGDALNKVCKKLEEYEELLHLYADDKKLKESLELLKHHTDKEGLKIIEKLEGKE